MEHKTHAYRKPTIRRVASLPERGSWAAPLPDLSQPAIDHRIRIGTHVFRVAISAVQRDVEREPDTHLVQIGIFYGERPLTPHDLGLQSADACANVWAYLTNRVNDVAAKLKAAARNPAEAKEWENQAAGMRDRIVITFGADRDVADREKRLVYGAGQDASVLAASGHDAALLQLDGLVHRC